MGLSIIASIAFTFSSCDDENNSIVPEDRKPSAPSGQVTDITFYTADITGRLELSKEELNQSEFGLLLSTSEDVMAVNSDKYPIKNFDKDYSFTLSLSGLDSVTTYYYRSYIYYEGNYIYSDVQSFTTRSPLDIIKTGSLSSDSCTVISRIDSKNLIDYIQTYGICYGTTLIPSLKDQFVITDSLGAENKFNLKLHDIPFDTLVNYRAFVRVNNIDFFGPTLQFQGNTVRTGDINITDYTVTSHLKINDGYKELGVCYGMDSIPSISNEKVNTTTIDDNNDYKLKLVNIPFDTIVYYRAYALTADSIYYGKINSFGGNTVTTGIIDTITFQVQSSVRFNDGITQYGVCYSNSEKPITLDKTVYVEQPDSAGFYTLSLANIPFGTVYYRSYVLKDGIAYYGDIRKFEGNSITTGDFNSESLAAKSIIKFSNSYDNPQIGICYGNNQKPTIADKHVFSTLKDTVCNYELLLRNIPFGTVYYRAYMMVDGVPNYGEIKQLEGNYITINSFVDSTFTVNSSIKYSIGYEVLNLGVCYSNKENPTIKDRVVSTNSVDSLNSFVLQLNEIPFGTVYYRTFMICDGVPQYSEIKNFEGNEITTGVCDTTTYMASASLKITKGYNSFDMGICYSNNAQPTINDLKVSTDKFNSANNYSVQLTRIPFGTVYYRSYMMLDGKANYGEIKSFDGNYLETGDIDTTSYAVLSHIAISQGYNNIIYGICYGFNEIPTISDQTVTVDNVDTDNNYALTLILDNKSFGRTVYYRSYVLINNVPYYGEVKSFERKMPIGKMVDLGLSVMWSSFNVGAEKPEDFGCYYAWGETDPKTVYNWTTYKYCNGSSTSLTKYCINYSNNDYNGFVDGITELEAIDDVAQVKWGDKWRMPKYAELRELQIYCTWTWTTVNGINGYIVRSNQPGYTERYIFLPAAGYYESDKKIQPGSWDSHGCWSSSLGDSEMGRATCMHYNEGSLMISVGASDRYRGYPVRPVRTSDEWLSSTDLSLSNDTITLLPGKSFLNHSIIKHNGEEYYYVCEWISDNPSVASVDDGRIYAKSKGIAHITCTVASSLTAQCTVIVVEDESEIKHEYVDLGLSVKWATYNVGAISEDDFGDFFAWGELQSKDFYFWNTYTHCSGDGYSITKYYNDKSHDYYDFVDSKYNLDIEDDVAHVKWGGNWRMPTQEEMEELVSNCSWTYIKINGYDVYKVTSTVEGFTDNYIYLPSAGHKQENNWADSGKSGNYWTSTLSTFYESTHAVSLEFYRPQEINVCPYNRMNGISVRPVHP